tara:strand:+ start:798 stop:989 length:192 start_codon:yes stop_codon:yes gene_type:complete
MDLGDGLIAGLILGYYFLLRAVLNKSVSFAVELWVETYETEKNWFSAALQTSPNAGVSMNKGL